MHSVGIAEYALPLAVMMEARRQAIKIYDKDPTINFDNEVREQLKKLIIDACWVHWGELVEDDA
jgi:hypothetical protein